MFSKPSVVVLTTWVVIVLAALFLAYRLIDPLPPRRVAIAAGPPGSGYDNFARQYARILARHGVELVIRNSAGAVEDLELLRDGSSGVQAGLTTFGITEPSDDDKLYSLGGVFDAPIFIFYRSREPITQFAQMRGKRLSLGKPGTALRSLMVQVMDATGASGVSTVVLDLDASEMIEALLAGTIDVAIFPSQLEDRLDAELVERALGTTDLRLMNVAQAEAIAKTVPGLKHVILWRGLISLSRDVPSSDFDLLASRNRMLVRKDLHPALQYLLLEAMREAHAAPGPFSRLGEFPAPQPSDLALSPTAEAFYRSGQTFWQRYTSFWLASLLNRMVFFVIPILVALIPVIGFAPRVYRWLYLRRINQLHWSLGQLEQELSQHDNSRFGDYERHIAEVESVLQSLKVARPFEVDLHRLRVHLRVVQEELSRMRVGEAASADALSGKAVD